MTVTVTIIINKLYRVDRYNKCNYIYISQLLLYLISSVWRRISPTVVVGVEMLNWQSGVNICHDNGSKTLPVIPDHVTGHALMEVLGRLPLHMELCPIWLHLSITPFNSTADWRWLDNSPAGTQFTQLPYRQ